MHHHRAVHRAGRTVRGRAQPITNRISSCVTRSQPRVITNGLAHADGEGIRDGASRGEFGSPRIQRSTHSSSSVEVGELPRGPTCAALAAVQQPVLLFL